MLRIVSAIASIKDHVKTMIDSPDRYRPSCCPECGLKGLWAHGTYERKADRGSGHPNLVEVPRFICGKNGGCGASCSTLPSCVSPRRWYDWATQAEVVKMLLDGASLKACARQLSRARSTVRRWWRWLEAQHHRFAFELLTRHSEWGRFARWQEFWQRALQSESLEALMTSLDQAGVAVP